MTVPKHPGKVDLPSIADADQLIAYGRSRGDLPEHSVPESIILTFQRRLIAGVVEKHELPLAAGFSLHLIEGEGAPIGLQQLPIGAAGAVTMFENLIALGGRRFLSIGTAGALVPGLEPGDLFVCDRALRDEGTSHHYVRGARFAHPGAELTTTACTALRALGREFTIGAAWTTDAPYRETRAEVEQYTAEGISVVEMEAAALFAVAEYRGVELGAMFCVSDSLAGGSWKIAFRSENVAQGLLRLYYAAERALRA